MYSARPITSDRRTQGCQGPSQCLGSAATQRANLRPRRGGRRVAAARGAAPRRPRGRARRRGRERGRAASAGADALASQGAGRNDGRAALGRLKEPVPHRARELGGVDEGGAGVSDTAAAAMPPASVEADGDGRLHLHADRPAGGFQRCIREVPPTPAFVAAPPPTKAQRGRGVRTQGGADLGEGGAAVCRGAASGDRAPAAPAAPAGVGRGCRGRGGGGSRGRGGGRR